jgi:hypothetical protein
MIVTSDSNTDNIRIFINGYLHIYILKQNLVAINSFKNAENDFSTHIHFKTTTIKLQYDKKELWSNVLLELNNKL